MTAERVFLKSTRGGPKLKMLYIYFLGLNAICLRNDYFNVMMSLKC